MMKRSMLLALSLGTLSMPLGSSSNLPAQYLPIYGGANGNAFTRSCGAGKVLTGLTYRAGNLMDAVGVLCRPVNSNGQLGAETTVGTLAGGTGGQSGVSRCPAGKVVAAAEIHHGSFVDGVGITCKNWQVTSRSFVETGSMPLNLIGRESGDFAYEKCETATQPANGIRGRAHSLVDAIGFICDEP